MSQSEAPHPDLSHLPYVARVRIAVAETQGATWNTFGDGSVALEASPPYNFVVAFYVYRAPCGEWTVNETLPDYWTDPAAWGALEEAERVEVRYEMDEVWARCEGRPMPDWTQMRTRPEAVCAAVLAKYGREVAQ